MATWPTSQGLPSSSASQRSTGGPGTAHVHTWTRTSQAAGQGQARGLLGPWEVPVDPPLRHSHPHSGPAPEAAAQRAPGGFPQCLLSFCTKVTGLKCLQEAPLSVGLGRNTYYNMGGGGGGASQNRGSVQTHASLPSPRLPDPRVESNCPDRACRPACRLPLHPHGSPGVWHLRSDPRGLRGGGGRASSELRGDGAPTPPAQGRAQAP